VLGDAGQDLAEIAFGSTPLSFADPSSE
jgi:hypothetical protein